MLAPARNQVEPLQAGRTIGRHEKLVAVAAIASAVCTALLAARRSRAAPGKYEIGILVGAAVMVFGLLAIIGGIEGRNDAALTVAAARAVLFAFGTVALLSFGGWRDGEVNWRTCATIATILMILMTTASSRLAGFGRPPSSWAPTYVPPPVEYYSPPLPQSPPGS